MSIPKVIKLSGVSFYQDIIKTLKENDILTMELDTDNKYDSNAIKILKDNTICGYIPKKYKINDTEIILNELIKNKFVKLNKRYNLVVKNIYKWTGPTGIEIEFTKI